MLRLRRGDRHPDARRRDPPGPRPRVDGHRRRDRLQHRLRQHLPVQPVPRAVDELAVRERPGRRARASAPAGTRPAIRPAAVGPRRRRRDVRHRLPGAVADGRLGRRHQGPRARHAGLLEHRRPGLDRVVRRAGHQALRVRQGAPRPARAAQGAGADPDGPRRGLRRPDHAGPPQPLLPRDHGGQRLPGPAVVASTPRACPSTASPTTQGRFAPHFAGSGEPSAEIQATQEDRLANWRTLQELAGLRPGGA